MSIEAEKQEPVAWMYEGEPYFDGNKFIKTYKYTDSQKYAVFMSGTVKKPQPLYAHPQPKREQEPVGFAGVKIWVGNHQIKQFLTKVEMESAYEPWLLIEWVAQKCIELLKEKNT